LLLYFIGRMGAHGLHDAASALEDPRGANLLLRQAMGCDADIGALAAAPAVCMAFEDLGQRLG
jgi:hypothetical protein